MRTHCHEIKAAEGIVIIHPNWWGQPPAILKGWIDRVIRPGVAYAFAEGDSGGGVPAGLLKAKIADSTLEERQTWLEEVKNIVKRSFPKDKIL